MNSDLSSPSMSQLPRNPNNQPGPTNAQYLLGLFILWQIVFLFAANIIAIARDVQENNEYLTEWARNLVRRRLPGFLDKDGHVHDATLALEAFTSRWSTLTNQPQSWSLFAPTIGRHNRFVAVEFRWDDDWPDEGARGPAQLNPLPPDTLYSDNEPENMNHYFRFSKFRIRSFEGHLDIPLYRKEIKFTLDDRKLMRKEMWGEAAERWQRQIESHVGKEWDTILAYLKWRTRVYLEKYPDKPAPKQVLLKVRRYWIPPPGKFIPWDGPSNEVYLARWRPLAPITADYRPIEWYDPITVNHDGLYFVGLLTPQLALIKFGLEACQQRRLLQQASYQQRWMKGRFRKLSP